MANNRKTESRAITTLRSIVDDHPTMDHHFFESDKEMCWDGYIRIFKDDNKPLDKSNYDDDVPVQIKGHVVKDGKYTVFTIVFYSMANEILIDYNSLKNFQTFVDMYSLFSNDMEFNIDDDEKRYFDRLKKYKLASSEGLNKHTNRTIRFNVLKDFMFSEDEELSRICTSLKTKMENTKTQVEEDPDE